MKHINHEEVLLVQVKTELDCWSRGDTEGYGQFASDDVTYFHEPPRARIDGIRAFHGFLSELKGQIPPHKYKIVDPKVQMYGNVGIYTLQYHVLSPDGELIGRARGTCVYRYSEETWEMVHAHWSGLEKA